MTNQVTESDFTALPAVVLVARGKPFTVFVFDDSFEILLGSVSFALSGLHLALMASERTPLAILLVFVFVIRKD